MKVRFDVLFFETVVVRHGRQEGEESAEVDKSVGGYCNLLYGVAYHF